MSGTLKHTGGKIAGVRISVDCGDREPSANGMIRQCKVTSVSPSASKVVSVGDWADYDSNTGSLEGSENAEWTLG